jgi:hypothetical protein
MVTLGDFITSRLNEDLIFVSDDKDYFSEIDNTSLIVFRKEWEKFRKILKIILQINIKFLKTNIK